MPTDVSQLSYEERIARVAERGSALAREHYESAAVAWAAAGGDRRGRAQSDATKRKLSEARFLMALRDARADPTTSKLKRLRLESGFTRDALSAEHAISRDAIFRAEHAPDTVTPMVWRRLAKALGCSVADIKPDDA